MCSLMDVLTVKEASKRLRISERTCWTIIKDGRLAATYVTPFTVRVTEKSIQEFLLNNTRVEQASGAPGEVDLYGVGNAA